MLKFTNTLYMGKAKPKGGGDTINNQDVTITPTTSAQTLDVPEGYTGYGTISVNAVTSSIDNNITAGNIKDGVSILGVEGTLTPSETVQATNLTGSAITAGDKVFLKEKASFADNGTTIISSPQGYSIINIAGTIALDTLYAYTIPAGGQSGVNWSSEWIKNHGVIRCEGSRLFVDEFVITNNIDKTGGYRYAQDNYAMNWSAGLIKLDSNFDYSNPVQSWTLTGLDNTNDINDIVVVGNKLYLCKATDSGTKVSVYKGTIDENESSVAMTLFDSANCSYPAYSVYNMVKYPAVTTADNKVGIAGNFLIDASKGVLGFKLLSIDANGDVTGYKTTNNGDLALFATNATGTMFNRDTGLFVVKNNSFTGIFSYNANTQDFDTVLVLSVTGSLGATISSDMSKLLIDGKVYAITTSSTGYKAVEYNPFLGDKVVTGFASENAQTNATFNAEINAYEKLVDRTKYGITINSVLGDTDANGVLQAPTTDGNLVFSGVKEIVAHGLEHTFAYKKSIKSISFPDLEELTQDNSLDYLCWNCINITSISFPKLQSISGSQAIRAAFSSCKLLTSASLPELEEITGWESATSLFSNCIALTSVLLPKLSILSSYSALEGFCSFCDIRTIEFPMLSDISGNQCLRRAFSGNSNLTSISFPALKTTSFGSYTNQFNIMFDSSTAQTSGAFTVHFPSNLEATIQGLTGYPDFGATAGRLTLAFDLPATE